MGGGRGLGSEDEAAEIKSRGARQLSQRNVGWVQRLCDSKEATAAGGICGQARGVQKLCNVEIRRVRGKEFVRRWAEGYVLYS